METSYQYDNEESEVMGTIPRIHWQSAYTNISIITQSNHLFIKISNLCLFVYEHMAQWHIVTMSGYHM
jgi:hypothetical protein